MRHCNIVSRHMMSQNFMDVLDIPSCMGCSAPHSQAWTISYASSSSDRDFSTVNSVLSQSVESRLALSSAHALICTSNSPARRNSWRSGRRILANRLSFPSSHVNCRIPALFRPLATFCPLELSDRGMVSAKSAHETPKLTANCECV